MVDQFCFQCAEEALRNGIVMTFTFTAHTADQTVIAVPVKRGRTDFGPLIRFDPFLSTLYLFAIRFLAADF